MARLAYICMYIEYNMSNVKSTESTTRNTNTLIKRKRKRCRAANYGAFIIFEFVIAEVVARDEGRRRRNGDGEACKGLADMCSR